MASEQSSVAALGNRMSDEQIPVANHARSRLKVSRDRTPVSRCTYYGHQRHTPSSNLTLPSLTLPSTPQNHHPSILCTHPSAIPNQIRKTKKSPLNAGLIITKPSRSIRLRPKHLTQQLANLRLLRLSQHPSLNLHREAIDVFGNRTGVFLAGEELIDTPLAR
jgi:hypothetical protein